MAHTWELRGKVGSTEVWLGKHSPGGRADGKLLTFYVITQCRYHTWTAWLHAHNDGWDGDYDMHKEKQTPDQEVLEVLNEVINDHSKDPHPGSFTVYARGESSEDARNRLISVISRVAEVIAPAPKKAAKKKKKTEEASAGV